MTFEDGRVLTLGFGKGKVTWSKYTELPGSAILVLVATTIFAAIIFGIDWVFQTGIKWFYREF